METPPKMESPSLMEQDQDAENDYLMHCKICDIWILTMWDNSTDTNSTSASASNLFRVKFMILVRIWSIIASRQGQGHSPNVSKSIYQQAVDQNVDKYS